jgi:hypothetical protein
LQADLPIPRHALGSLDPLVHAVHYRPAKVRLGVGEAGLVVRAGSLGQGEISLTLQVIDKDFLLPMRTVLDEELRKHRHQPRPLSG